MNVVVLTGRLSSEPTVRELPSGSVLMTFEVTTRVGDAQVSVPLVWFDPPKEPVVGSGDEVCAVGAVRRRFYRAGGTTQSRTEVVISNLGRVGGKRAAALHRRWIAEALGAEACEALQST